MSRKFTVKLFAAAIVLSPISLVATTLPASAQGNFGVSFGYFYDELAPYGQWFHHPRWGDVWQPRRVSRDFRPYNRGHWDYTNRFGWVWASDYEWGDIPFHYGRWVYDPYDGWLWVPGYVWAPAWVVWRSGGGYVGWLPMPPDEAFLAGDEVYRTNWDNWDRGYGYTDWYGPRFGPSWLASIGVFVDERHFADRDFNRYVAPPNQLVSIVNNTRNVTNYVTVNNYIVNQSVDPAQIQRASGRQIVAVPEQQIVRSNVPIVPVNLGREVQQQERRQHGGDPRASAQARVVALTPEAAHANAPPNDVGNNRPGDNQPGGRFNRNNQQANQPGAPAEQRPGLRPNEVVPPAAQAQSNRERAAADAQAQANRDRADRERAAAQAQSNRERAAAEAQAQAQANRERAAAEAQRADQGRAAAQAQANRERAAAEAQAQAANRERAAVQAQAANRERAAAEAQAQANRDRAAAEAQAANRERAAAQAQGGRPPRAQPEAPPPARSEAAPAAQPQEKQVNNERNQRQRRDQKDQKNTN